MRVCVSARVRVCRNARARARATAAAPCGVRAGCHGNAPRPELIISCGKCAGGAERGGPRRQRRGAASCPLAGPGRAPGAAATPGSCLRQAGESGARTSGRAGGGLGARDPPGPLFGAPRLGPPCPQHPLTGPAEGRREGPAPETQLCAVPCRPPSSPAGAEDLARNRARGGRHVP